MGTIYAGPFIIMSAVFLFVDFIIILAIILLHKRGKKTIVYALICLLVILMILTIFSLYLALLGYGGIFNPIE